MIACSQHSPPSLAPQHESMIFSTSFSENLRAIGGLTVEEFLHTPERNLPPIRYDIGFSNATSPWIYPREVKEELEPESEDPEEVEPAQKSTKIVCERVAEKVVQLSIPHSDESNPVRRIESYFNRWRPGKGLQWFYYFNEPGAALRVQLAPNTFRIYSTPLDPTSSPEQMQLECAQIAIDAGVLDFIKVPSGAVPSSNKGCSAMWPSVQEYIQKSLPRPFPEPEFADDAVKAEAEILDWFNKSSQSANKSRTIPLKISFHFLQNKQTHGCLLRVEDPQKNQKDAQSYLVEPGFSKRNNAKVAVCLRAMSEGVGRFFRSFADVDTPAVTENNEASLVMKRYADETVWPQLLAACKAIGPQVSPAFFYQNNNKKGGGSIGCTLKLMVPPPSEAPLDPTVILNKNNTVSRKYNVPMQYHSQDSARIAVLCLAGQKGAVQFVKDRGNALSVSSLVTPPPPMSETNMLQAKPSQAKKRKDRKKNQPQTSVNANATQPNLELPYEPEPGELAPSMAGPSRSNQTLQSSQPPLPAALPRKPNHYPNRPYVPYLLSYPYNPSQVYGAFTAPHVPYLPGLGMYGNGTGGNPYMYPSGSAYPSHPNTFPFGSSQFPPPNSNRSGSVPSGNFTFTAKSGSLAPPNDGTGLKRKQGSVHIAQGQGTNKRSKM